MRNALNRQRVVQDFRAGSGLLASAACRMAIGMQADRGQTCPWACESRPAAL
jgi:hypothetical protein